jgi:hypothetical protein
MKLPQVALRKVSPGLPVMTVCESTVLAALPGKDAKRDLRRPHIGATVTFVAKRRRALLHTQGPLYTPAGVAGLPQVDKSGLLSLSRGFFRCGMRAATGLPTAARDSRTFCQIGDQGT